jgi:mono/diheme cytochrome c family protein
MAQSPDSNRLAHGHDVYAHNCSGCHGDNADGKGLADAALRPRAIDLHVERFSEAHLATVLWDGVYGSAMPAWRQLEKSDLEDVTTYVRSLEAQAASPTMSPDQQTAAATVYAANCVSCHGAAGRGDGPAAGALKPSPVNFQVRQPSTERARTVLNDGISGSAMPAWKSRLTQQEIESLIPYIQRMYGEPMEVTHP